MFHLWFSETYNWRGVFGLSSSGCRCNDVWPLQWNGDEYHYDWCLIVSINSTNSIKLQEFLWGFFPSYSTSILCQASSSAQLPLPPIPGKNGCPKTGTPYPHFEPHPHAEMNVAILWPGEMTLIGVRVNDPISREHLTSFCLLEISWCSWINTFKNGLGSNT